MNPSRWNPPFWVGDREFSAEDLGTIRNIVYRCRRLSREEIAATICENLSWKAPNGHLKVMACREMLKGMESAGLIELPPAKGSRRHVIRDTEARPVSVVSVSGSLAALRPVTLDPVTDQERRMWNATMAAYHPLGYRRPIGAHQRYWIRGRREDGRVILGCLLFGAAAKAVADRDSWIGWSAAERSRFRWRIVNNNRFLILPGVRIPHLASHVLGLAARQVPKDWERRYGYRPVLMETFVEEPWEGTCYLAANWLRLGETAGRGRQDRHREAALPVKSIWAYPLDKRWKKRLVEPAPQAANEDGAEDDF